jgi:hypothetical protein
MQDRAPVVYAYASLAELLERETDNRNKAELPGAGARPVTERPEPSRPSGAVTARRPSSS